MVTASLPRSASAFAPVRAVAFFGFVVSCLSLSALAQTPSSSCGSTSGRGGVVALHASATKSLSLCDGYAVGGGSGSLGTPLALASSDFDEDGVADLVSGFSSGSGGTVEVHRGNVAALWPYGAAIQNGVPAAFLPSPRSFSVPESPDFLVTGDFDADGHIDIVTAHKGSTALYFLKGNGHGGFLAAKRFALKGRVTDLIAGEMNQPDGLTDLVVGITGESSFAALVYQSPLGALKGSPETFALSQAPTALALGKFAGSTKRDLAIGAGNELTLVQGRDRKLASGSAEMVAPAVVTKQTLAYSILSLAAGDFTGRAPSIAALGNDGSVHILEHSVSAATLAEMVGSSSTPTMQAAGGKDVATGAAGTTSTQARITALRQMASESSNAGEWTERSVVALPNGASVSAHGLVAARISGSRQEDLIVVDHANSQVHILSTVSKGQARVASPLTASSALPQMKMLDSLTATSSPAAVLPMRLSQHGLNGLVTLQSNVSGPVVTPQDIAPAAVFTVTNTSDITDTSQKNTPPAGSLRKAMEDAQASGLCYNGTGGTGGTCSIVFNIPTSDPGYNSATGVWKIQPLSENVPGSLDNFALPPINVTITIDGYTQPGASPNTSATSDNAKIVIQIDGSKATTPGGSGFSPYFDSGTVLRGMALTGWTNPAISSSGTASGGMGVEMNGVADFAEGNFIGTLDGKTAATNRIGIFADNGPLSGNIAGNIIGGTTPQARNIISGNNVFGIAFLSIAYEAALQGNFVGLDSTGIAAIGNTQDGVGMNGPTVTIGGTLAGARNYIAGNGTNVDINDLTNGNAATGSYVQGNYIGTDVTGTKALTPNAVGVIIDHNPRNYLIGGTTPAARNIISGNSYGVYMEDNVSNNMVQGDYIGTDPTGAIAVPNAHQGIFIGNSSSSTSVAATNNTVGGAVAGSGNVISGNASDGVQMNGAYSVSPGYTAYLGNTVQGNFIGTDPTGLKSVPNQGNGVSVLLGGTNNVIGGASGGVGNVIANNTGHGVLIDPGATGGPGVANTTVANIIYSNGGAGVRVNSGSGNRISANSIYSNAALGIDIAAAGVNTNSHCQVTNTGGNLSQNYPVLTAGAGTNYITATATDAAGNTSEFSKAVQATQAANVLSLLGSFDGTANSTFTIEFFSNPSADSSGYGQGKTYLGSTTIKTDANCAGTITNPVDLTGADVSVTQAFSSYALTLGPDFGLYAYNSTLANNGPATAHNVIFTDTLPSQLTLSSTYCNIGACQSPIKTSQGTCTISGKTITCSLGALAPGGIATVSIPVQAIATGSVTNTVNVTATEIDPNLLNNVASSTITAQYPYPSADHLDPSTFLAANSAVPMNVYGLNFTGDDVVTINGAATKVLGIVDNQICGSSFSPEYCSALQISVPASIAGTPGTYTVDVSNPTGDSTLKFIVVGACTYTVNNFISSPLDASGTNLIADSVSVYTNGVSGCAWTATSSAPWLQVLDNASASGSGTVDIAVAPNTTTSTRSATLTIAGQTFNYTQNAGTASTCSVSFNPSSLTPDANGGSGTVTATQSASGCAPFVEVYPQSSSTNVNAPWITATSTAFASGPINYTIAKNNGPARTGAIVDGGNAVIVTQAAPSCYFTLSPGSIIASSAGSTGSFTVTPTPSSCSWTATPSSTSQVTVTSGASGTGNGTISFTVAPNLGNPITPTIIVGNAVSTSIFTINQVAPSACTFTVSPTPVSVTSSGTSNYFVITASFSFCQWTAVSNNPDVLEVTGNPSGVGSKAIYYSVARNTGAARTLTITAGCQTFLVNQSGPLATVANNPAPTLTSLLPSSTTAGSAAFTLTVTGTGFINGSIVNFNGGPRTTTYVSATQLTASIPATDVVSAGTATITVVSPTPGGGTSNALPFTISAAANPAPAVSLLSPSSTTAGSAAFTLTVNGTGFVSGSTVTFNGSARATTYVSATQLTAAILASDVATQGTVPVAVTSPSPGGGTSNSVAFTINAASNPTPTLTSLAPSSIAAGSAAFTLTVNGTGFVSGSTVNFNGNARTTSYVSATQVTAAILASDVATQGTAAVTVTSPASTALPTKRQDVPVNVSNSLTFTISAANNPTPVLTSLQTANTNAGSSAFTLTVNGTGFVSGSMVSFSGNPRATTYVSATQLTAAILANDVATKGTASVTVTNPSPGGGTSNSLVFTINDASNPTPVVTALSPSSTAAGSAAFSLTISGTGFVSGSAVTFNGSARATTYVSATQLTAAILTSDVATQGAAAVTVTSPTPGGGTSNALTFTISAANNPTPTLTSLAPGSITAGAAAFTLTVNGTGFVTGSTVNVNGSPRTTTVVSATQLSAAILASDVATQGTASITATSPTPGGGTSNALTFIINAANNPTPVLTAITPGSTTAGSAAFLLTINGTGFVSSSTVSFNGSARATSYVSATQLTASILASDVATQGAASVTVTSPTPGGGTSNALTFTINAVVATNPIPVLTALQPASATAGSAAFTLTVSGTGFASGATVTFNGVARVTSYVSATQVTAAILASDVVSAGTASVTVTNPTPGGGTSNTLPFAITAVVATNPVPTISTLQPTSVTAGSGALSLTVNGTNFLSSSTVTVNGSARAVTFVSATQLTVAVLAADVATAGTASVVVTNPTPGGGASNTATLTIMTASVASYALSSTTGAQTILPGGSAQYSITVAALNGTYSSPVTLSASGLPSGFSATFSPASVTPGSTSSTSTLTIQAPLHAELLREAGKNWPVVASIFPLFGLLLMRRRRHGVRLMLVLLALCGLCGLTGCGGGFSYSGTNPQSYTVTVTGTSGTTQQTTALKLTVNF